MPASTVRRFGAPSLRLTDGVAFLVPFHGPGIVDWLPGIADMAGYVGGAVPADWTATVTDPRLTEEEAEEFFTETLGLKQKED